MIQIGNPDYNDLRSIGNRTLAQSAPLLGPPRAACTLSLTPEEETPAPFPVINKSMISGWMGFLLPTASSLEPRRCGSLKLRVGYVQ